MDAGKHLALQNVAKQGGD